MSTESNVVNESLTRQVLSGRSILITGTTGFVGKVLLEKIIREIPDIGAIYLLIRGSTKYPDADSRFLHEVACTSIFDRLKLEDTRAFETFCHQKVHCITGEITEPYFGVGRERFETLAAKVDLIINSAASVNFREELDVALKINTLSLHNLVEFSRFGGNTPLLQVSTCYVNGFNKGFMPESNVAPAGMPLVKNARGYFEVDELIAELQKKIDIIHSRFIGESLKQKLIDLGIEEANRYGWNDTYTFTKWMGEQLLYKALLGYSLTICRPAIIESTLAEPAPGWIEGVKVADAIIMAYAREKVSFFPGKANGVIDIIPADLVANSLILASAELFLRPGKHRIYQCCSGSSNPVTLGQFRDYVQQEAKENFASHSKLFLKQPTKPFIFVSKAVFVSGMSMLKALVNAKSKIPLVAASSKDKLTENISTAITLSKVFSFYTAPNYIFTNDKLLDLAERMGRADQALFPVDPKVINWKHYVRKIHIPGLNRYALSERKLYTINARKQKKDNRAA